MSSLIIFRHFLSFLHKTSPSHKISQTHIKHSTDFRNTSDIVSLNWRGYKCPVSTSCSVRGVRWAHQSYFDTSFHFATKPLYLTKPHRHIFQIFYWFWKYLLYSFLKRERFSNALFQLLVLLEAWHELINHIPTLPLIFQQNLSNHELIEILPLR